MFGKLPMALMISACVVVGCDDDGDSGGAPAPDAEASGGMGGEPVGGAGGEPSGGAGGEAGGGAGGMGGEPVGGAGGEPMGGMMGGAGGGEVMFADGPCEDLDLPKAPFQTADGGTAFGDIAGDFTVQTLDGPWQLTQNWSGCESYVFLNYFQDLRQGGGGPWQGDQLWGSDLSPLYQQGPRNVHYFFTSFEEELAEREARMNTLRDGFDRFLGANVADAADRAYWRSHFHFVTDRMTEIEGSAGLFARNYLDFMFSDEGVVDLGDRGMAQAPLPDVFAINRHQQFDPVGSLSPVVGQPPNFEMAAYAGHFYNHLSSLDARLADTSEITEVTLLERAVTERVFTEQVELPSAEEMAAFNTLEVDIQVTCPFQHPFACSEWDRIARISLCLDEECAQRQEIMRWITPYWRRGRRRWAQDISPMLALLRAGGTQRFFIEMGPDWERKTERNARITLRFSEAMPAAGPEGSATGGALAFTGGAFDENYNTREPFTFTAPEGTRRAELVTIISGHGQTPQDNCAEWCDHRHQFTLNDVELTEISSAMEAGTLKGCAERAGEGVPPGQWGNWAPGRAYWCPGLPVDLIRLDITDHITPGAESTLTYRGLFNGGDPRGGDIALSAYVIWYE
ncbi:MAG: peptide-N-glycosidase F-related protein [Bradymonadia bacterium]